VDQQRQYPGAGLGVLAPPLLGANAALYHRVNRLEVARVRGERDVELVSLPSAVVRAVAPVVLDVAVAADDIGLDVVLELVEDHVVGLVEDVGEHVQPAAVRHSHHHLIGSGLGRGLHESVQGGNQGLGPFE